MSKAISVLLRCLAYLAIAVALVSLVFSVGMAIVWLLVAVVLVLLSLRSH